MKCLGNISAVICCGIALAACDAGRSEGHIDVQLVNLSRENTARTVEVSLVTGSTTYTEAHELESLVGDSISFAGFHPGSYTARAQSLDGSGRVLQRGLSPQFDLGDGEVIEAPTVMVEGQSAGAEPCVPGVLRCEFVPGFDLVLECIDGLSWSPVVNCGGQQQCVEAQCTAGSPHKLPSPGENNELLLSVCNPGEEFSTVIDHPFYPLEAGHTWELEGIDDGDFLVVEITVLDQTEVIDGVTTRVVQEIESEGGEVQQRTQTYFAQAADGTVCYFGEDVWEFDDTIEIFIDAFSWRSDVANNLFPGIIMPANPAVGMTYQQAVAPLVALDRSEIIAISETIAVEAGTFDNTVWVLESSPLDVGTSLKVYASGIGLVADEDLELIQFTAGLPAN